MKSPWESDEWAAYIPPYVALARARFRHIHRLNEHDWDDIEQEARIRVWNQRERADPALPLQPWVRTVVANSVSNSVRNRFPGRTIKDKETRRLKYEFYWPRRLVRYQADIDQWDDKHWVREDDVLDQRTLWPDLPAEAELLEELTPIERRYLKYANDGLRTSEIAGKRGMKSYATAYSVLERIRRKWLHLVDQPYRRAPEPLTRPVNFYPSDVGERILAYIARKELLECLEKNLLDT